MAHKSSNTGTRDKLLNYQCPFSHFTMSSEDIHNGPKAYNSEYS